MIKYHTTFMFFYEFCQFNATMIAAKREVLSQNHLRKMRMRYKVGQR